MSGTLAWLSSSSTLIPFLLGALYQIIENFGNSSDDSDSSSSEDEQDYSDPKDPEIVAKAKKEIRETGEYTFTERDVALYNLGIGANEKEVQYVFEGDSDFQAIPSFGVIPQFSVSSGLARERDVMS